MTEAKPDVAALQDIENEVRNLKNWVAVFAQEYSLPEEALNKLNEKVDQIAQKVGAITCK